MRVNIIVQHHWKVVLCDNAKQTTSEFCTCNDNTSCHQVLHLIYPFFNSISFLPCRLCPPSLSYFWCRVQIRDRARTKLITCKFCFVKLSCIKLLHHTKYLLNFEMLFLVWFFFFQDNICKFILYKSCFVFFYFEWRVCYIYTLINFNKKFLKKKKKSCKLWNYICKPKLGIMKFGKRNENKIF